MQCQSQVFAETGAGHSVWLVRSAFVMWRLPTLWPPWELSIYIYIHMYLYMSIIVITVIIMFILSNIKKNNYSY